jgi:hypothetical protein
MNKLKQKIIETEKQLLELKEKRLDLNFQLEWGEIQRKIEIRQSFLSALELAGEIETENVKKLREVLNEGVTKDAWGYEIITGDWDGLNKKINKVFE